MGELTKIDTWLTDVEAATKGLVEAAKTGSELAVAVATAEARLQLAETLTNESVRARLLAFSDERVNMVELANGPTDDDRVNIMAIAILSGFTPGKDEFSIFGGGYDKARGKPRPGKLYIKSAGYRTLFAHLGITPDVETEHPVWTPLGKTGKHVWQVAGRASCEYRGESHSVVCQGPAAIGLPGYETDNVAGITVKAQRRLLRDLWCKVSPILTSGHNVDEPEDVNRHTDEPPLIEVTKDPKDDLTKTWAHEVDRLKGRAWDAGHALLTALGNDGDTSTIMEHVAKCVKDGEIDARAQQTLERLDAAITNLRGI